MTVIIEKFKEFPDAYPHFPEEQIPSKRVLAREYLSRDDFVSAKSLNRKIEDALDFYDLKAMSNFGVPITAKNLQHLRAGFMGQNITPYTSKRENARRGYFDDPDSRWFGMTRPEAREIILMEIFTRRDEGSAATPTPTGGSASAAQTGGIPDWIYPVGGLVLALGIGYGFHKVTSQGTSPR